MARKSPPVVPQLGLIAYRTEDVFREEGVCFGLAYQRRTALRRLALVVSDQLELHEDVALVLAAGLVSVGDARA